MVPWGADGQKWMDLGKALISDSPYCMRHSVREEFETGPSYHYQRSYRMDLRVPTTLDRRDETEMGESVVIGVGNDRTVLWDGQRGGRQVISMCCTPQLAQVARR